MIASKRSSLGVRGPSDRHGSVLGPRRRNFSPTAYGSLAAWYDVSDYSNLFNNAGARPANGDGIKLIADKSGNSAVNRLMLNATNLNYASVPHSAATSLTGDKTIIVGAACADWTPASASYLAGKSATANQKCWRLAIGTNGRPIYTQSFDGTSYETITATAAPVVSDFGSLLLAVTRQSSSGNVKFYTAPMDFGLIAAFPTGWTQLGATVAGTSGATFAGTSPHDIGTTDGGYSGITGAISYFQIWDGYDGAGTPQLNINFTTVTKLATSFTESSSNAATVTINSSGDLGARISGERDLVQLTASKQPLYTASGTYLTFDGTDDYMKAAAFSLSQPETVYFVGQQVTWTSGDYVYDGNTLDRMSLYQNTSTPQVSIYAGAGAGAVTTWAVATTAVVSSVFNGASSSNRLNRTAAVTGNAGANNASGFSLGANGTPSGYGNIRANEIALFSAAHDTAVQGRFALGLGAKWAISV